MDSKYSIIEVVGDDNRQKEFANKIKDFTVKEIVKSGKVVISKVE